MKVQLESTSKIVSLRINGVDVPARVWQGTAENGIGCHAFVTRVAVQRDEDTSEFSRDLQKHAAPSPVVQSIPLSMIL